jgi:hypothetical protein
MLKEGEDCKDRHRHALDSLNKRPDNKQHYIFSSSSASFERFTPDTFNGALQDSHYDLLLSHLEK